VGVGRLAQLRNPLRLSASMLQEGGLEPTAMRASSVIGRESLPGPLSSETGTVDPGRCSAVSSKQILVDGLARVDSVANAVRGRQAAGRWKGQVGMGQASPLRNSRLFAAGGCAQRDAHGGGAVALGIHQVHGASKPHRRL